LRASGWQEFLPGVTLVGDARGVEIQPINSGATAALLLGVVWQKSSYSNPCGSCVEVAQLTDGRIAIRNSRHPGGTALIYPRAEMAAFIHRTKAGELDNMTGESTA
jgi:hypothetical protein